MTWALYIASVVGAVSLYLMMPRQGFNPRAFGALLGAMSLGGLWIWLAATALPNTGLPSGALPYYYIFSALAIGSAVRVITHPRPVYSALWFVLVVLASAGLFLLLTASFMAVAMVIIYGGAILVTYMFVIMLAAQTGDAADQADVADYDRVAREPVAAIAAGFVLLAVLLTVSFTPGLTAPQPGTFESQEQALLSDVLVERPAMELTALAGPAAEEAAQAQRAASVDNVEFIGVDLFRSHPLGIELAGVILLVSLMGAVVIARMRVPEEADQTLAPAEASGASVRMSYEPGPHDPSAQGQSGGRVGV